MAKGSKTTPQTKPAYEDVTPEMIAEWKEKHQVPRISEVEFPIFNNEPEEGDARFFIFPPPRHVIEAAAIHVKNDRIKQANNLLVNTCALGGDMELVNQNNDVFFNLVNAISDLSPKAVANVKKH